MELATRLFDYNFRLLSHRVRIDNAFAWTESIVALSWILTESYKLNTYVANRVIEIQQITQPSIWNHIKGIEIPGDIASRGLLQSQLLSHPSWWRASHFLSQP